MTTLAPTEWPLLLEVTLDLRPRGNVRPRVTSKGTYMPRATQAWVAMASTRLAHVRARQRLSRWPRRAAVELELVTPRPQRCPLDVLRAEWETGQRILRSCKPDGDNAEKLVLDALVRAEILLDDTQVVACRWSRWMAAEGEEPSVRVVVRREP